MAVEHLYLHVPYCARKCPYCDFNSIAGRESEHAAYVDALLRELRSLPRGPYRTVFVGGGTPSELPPAQLERLLQGVRDHIVLSDDYEWTCEANPGSADRHNFATLAAAGVNRLSIGVQAVQDHHLRFLGRIHDVAEAEAVVESACATLPRVSADCIIGLPDQTVAEVEDTIAWIARRGLDHASVYHLAIEPGTEFHARHARGDLTTASQERSRVMLDRAWDTLEAAGLAAYETSNFARRGHECRHNLAYWRQRDYHAAGAGAVSTVDGLRSTREPHSGRYIDAITRGESAVWRREMLDVHTVVVEAWMLGLRLSEGVDLEQIEALGDPPARWADPVARSCAAGLVTVEGSRVRLTRAGRAVQDAVTVRLMPD